MINKINEAILLKQRFSLKIKFLTRFKSLIELRPLTLILFCLLIFTLTACGGGTNNTPSSDTSTQKQKVLTSIKLTSNETTLLTNSDTTLTVIATYDDNTTEDITADITWQIDDKKLASISTNGVVHANNFISAAGVTVTATFQNQTITSTFNITPTQDAVIDSVVFDSSIDVSQLNSAEDIIVKAVYSDGSISETLAARVQVQDASSFQLLIDNTVIDITQDPTAETTYNVITDVTTLPLTLSFIELTLSSDTVVSNEFISIMATGVMSDDSRINPLQNIEWFISGPISIDATGKITADVVTAPTTASVTAAVDGKTAAISITVLPVAVIADPTDPTVEKPILNSITITSTATSFFRGEEINLNALGLYSDTTNKTLTKNIVWNSSNAAAATVTATGRVIAGNIIGSAVISATVSTSAGDIKNEITIELLPYESINIVSPTNTTLRIGDVVSLSATANTINPKDITTFVAWSSSNPNVLSIDLYGQLRVGSIAGSEAVTITASIDGKEATIDISVELPLSISILASTEDIFPNRSIPLVVIAAYNNGDTSNVTNSVTWAIQNELIAKIQNNTLMSQSTIGSTLITATFYGIVSSKNVSISRDIATNVKSISFDNTYITLLTNKQFSAQVKVTYTDDSIAYLAQGSVDQPIEWSSFDESIATVDASGVVTTQPIGSPSAGAKILVRHEGFSEVLYVYVAKPESFDYAIFAVGVKAEQSRLEFESITPPPVIEAFSNPLGLLAYIPVKTPLAGHAITISSETDGDAIALLFDADTGTFNQSNASIIYVSDAGTNEFYTLESTSLNTTDSNTQLTLSVLVNGNKKAGEFTAELCKNSAIDNNTCGDVNNRITLSGVFSATIEAEKIFSGYTASSPKIIDTYTASSYQQVNGNNIKSYYTLNTEPGVSYEIKTTSLGASVGIQAFSGTNTVAEVNTENGDERKVTIIASQSTTTIAFEYLGAETGSSFKLDVTPLDLTAKGSLLNPFLINGVNTDIKGNVIAPVEDLLSVNDNTSYYKIPTKIGHLYRLYYSIQSETASGSTLSVSLDNSFSQTVDCDAFTCLNIKPASEFIYIKLNGPVGGQATVNVTLEYQTDSASLVVPIIDYKGQAGGPSATVTELQGSWYWITGLKPSTSYLVKITNVDRLVTMWINSQSSATTLLKTCNALGGGFITTEVYCLITTSASLNNESGFPINIVSDRPTGTSYTMNISEFNGDVFYISTFANRRTGLGNGSGITPPGELTLLELFRANDLTTPFFISRDNAINFTEVAFDTTFGETIYARVSDPRLDGEYYSIEVNKSGQPIYSSQAKPSAPDQYEANNDNSSDNATPLLLNEASHHSLVNLDGSLRDYDWFTFTAPAAP